MRLIRLASVLACLLLQRSTAFTTPLSSSGGRKIRCVRRTPNRSALSAANTLHVGKKGNDVAVAGKMFPLLSKLFITPAKARDIVANVGAQVDFGDLVLIAFFGWVLLPVSKFIYNRKHMADDPVQDFATSKRFKILTLISQAAKLGGIVYLIDVLSITLNVIGIKFPYKHNFAVKAAQVLFTTWAVYRSIPYKKYLIEKNVLKKSSGDDAKTRIRVYDTLANVIIVVITSFVILDELSIPIGKALQSLFALGGVGTLVFSLASKDVAAQVVNGVALASSNKYDEGDFILLGDGTEGVVDKMGLLSTDLRGPDEIITKIPNSQIAKQRVSNLSRLEKSQVKTTIHFAYEDLDKLPAVIANIKREIGDSCPNLITDGSRPFRVTWTDYNDDHLGVLVQCHFKYPPSSDAYWDTRQNVLLAIGRAAKKANVQFDIPNVRVKTRSEAAAGSMQQAYGIEDDHSVNPTSK